jgi:acetyl-CoA carboxylase biotin carboxyl carrier protein
MEVNQMSELMKALAETGLTDFEYTDKTGAVLKLKKRPEKKILAPVAPQEYMQPALMPQSVAESAPVANESANKEEISGNVVKSPLVGTFYSAASPDAAPYVQVGDVVSKGQVLGIVEAMKLMNEIESEFDGVVKAILVKNGDMIEFDQPMFVIE